MAADSSSLSNCACTYQANSMHVNFGFIDAVSTTLESMHVSVGRIRAFSPTLQCEQEPHLCKPLVELHLCLPVNLGCLMRMPHKDKAFA
jgi:hypothetical protein